MDDINTGELDTLIQEKLEQDTEFQTSIADLSEEERVQAIETKRVEVLKYEAAAILAKAKKDAELAENYKKRAEKAEQAKKTVKEERPSGDDLSTTDLYALMKSQVPEEDIGEVTKAAKLLGVTISEALKDPTVQGILKTKQEFRTSAQAANTRTARPTVAAPTDTEVLDKASKGDFPDKGTTEAEQLFWARRGGKR